MAERAIIEETSVPRLPRGVRLRDDEARGEKMLLGPERVLKLDAIAWEILSRVDGEARVGDIADDLHRRFNAERERVLADVTGFLQQLADKGFLAT